MNPQPSALLAALRAETAGAHHRIDALLRLDQAIDLDRYRAVLQGFDHFLSHWEPRLQAALPRRLRGWFRERSRLAFLRHDLQVLGAAAPPRSASGDPARDIPLDTLAAAFGAMYVLEGSALGGQVIARHVARQHGLGIDSGARYFIGWAERTGGLWREFRERLDAELGADAQSQVEACDAAVATFEALIRHFTAWPGAADAICPRC